MRTLYDVLQLETPALADGAAYKSGAIEEIDWNALSGKDFAQAVLNSPEFRAYIVEGIRAKTIPPAVMTRLMDHGWGKPAERVILDTPPVSEVRVVVVRPEKDPDDEEIVVPKVVTH